MYVYFTLKGDWNHHTSLRPNICGQTCSWSGFTFRDTEPVAVRGQWSAYESTNVKNLKVWNLSEVWEFWVCKKTPIEFVKHLIATQTPFFFSFFLAHVLCITYYLYFLYCFLEWRLESFCFRRTQNESLLISMDALSSRQALKGELALPLIFVRTYPYVF